MTLVTCIQLGFDLVLPFIVHHLVLKIQDHVQNKDVNKCMLFSEEATYLLTDGQNYKEGWPSVGQIGAEIYDLQRLHNYSCSVGEDL